MKPIWKKRLGSTWKSLSSCFQSAKTSSGTSLQENENVILMEESHKKRLGSADPSGLQPLALSAHNLLLLALHSLWKNPTGQELAYTFHTPRRTISFYQTRLWPILDQCLQEFVSPPVVRNPAKIRYGALEGSLYYDWFNSNTNSPAHKPCRSEVVLQLQEEAHTLCYEDSNCSWIGSPNLGCFQHLSIFSSW